MSKNCMNCKWYNNYTCNNKSLQIESEGDNTEENVIEFIEEGTLSEAIREEFDLNKLANDFLSELIELNYIKKNCIDKALSEKYEESENDIFETIEGKVSSILYSYFKNNKNKNSKLSINNPEDFSCCYWV